MAQNCWEMIKCGREPGGSKADEFGTCPAAMSNRFDGKNRGIHAGRYCWAINHTLCGDRKQGNWVNKTSECGNCDVFRTVMKEEGDKFDF